MTLQEVKQRFFAYRNGNTADILRRGGSNFSMIFGCELPVLTGIAREAGTDHELAMKLWNDANVRESRLLATFLMDSEALTTDDCVALANSTVDFEDALMLAFAVLKRRPDARQILDLLPRGSRQYMALSQHLDGPSEDGYHIY